MFGFKINFKKWTHLILQNNVFVNKYNATTGLITWTTTYDSGTDDIGEGIAVDPSGNIYVTGRGNNYYTWVTKYDTNANVLWTTSYWLLGSDFNMGNARATGIIFGSSILIFILDFFFFAINYGRRRCI